MNRLQKKCLIAAMGFHLLLLLILLVGPAFLSSRDQASDMPVLDFIPARLIDAPFSGGGSPTAKPPPPAPPVQPQPQPQVVSPPKAVEPPATKTFLQKIFEPEPPKEIVRSEEPDLTPKKATSAKPKIEVNLKPVTVTARSKTASSTDSETDSEAAAQARQLAAEKARQVAFSRSLRDLEHNLSSSTAVEIPGPGGESYANYAQIVKSIYTQAWIAPTDVADDESTAKVSVTIARDGTVLSARVTQPSGSAAVDRSVQRTLNRVEFFVAPFPDGAKEDQRTFIINFNLQAKRLLG